MSTFRRRVVLLAVLLCLATWASTAWAAKNVIILVADGAGHHAWMAASMYQGKLGKQTYDGPEWIELACTTYPLNTSNDPTGSNRQDARCVYDPAKFWDATAEEARGGGSGAFAGYNFAKRGATDSAAAATALATGTKTYNNAVNWTDDNRSLAGKTAPELAHARGKSCGVVTSVEWTHATPAGLGGAHNDSRDSYAAIANEMLGGKWLDVVMGAGHPDFTDDAQPRPQGSKRNYSYVGGKETWEQLVAGSHPGGWKLVQGKAEFEALTAGPTPKRVVGTAKAATTLQQNRDRGPGAAAGKKAKSGPPFSRPFNDDVPTLATMARAAINCLDDNPNGFYLMIEGGAVDWANHANDAGRMIEEQIAFVAAVEAVCQWVEANSNWNETLVILTADHETGMIWGPESDKRPFQPIEDRGAGQVPGLMYHSGSHTVSLVPLLARGADSRRFKSLVRGNDAQAGRVWSFSGDYVDNTDVFAVMRAAIAGE